MKKMLIIGLGLLYMAAEAQVIKGNYVRADKMPGGHIRVICKKSQNNCVVVVTNEDGGGGYEASVMNPDGSIAFQEAISDFSQADTPDGDIEVDLLP